MIPRPTRATSHRPSGCSSAIDVARSSSWPPLPPRSGDRLVGVEDEREAHDEKPRVEEPARDEPNPLQPARVLAALELLAQIGLGEAPQRISAEPDRERAEQEPSERALGDGLEGAGPVLELAAGVDCDLGRERGDDPVGDPLGDEAGTGEPLRPVAPRGPFGLLLGLPHPQGPILAPLATGWSWSPSSLVSQDSVSL